MPKSKVLMSAVVTDTLDRTSLYALHVSLGAKMVPFANYAMPVQYRAGLMAEHNHTRRHAGLFDVSHMGQIRAVGATAVARLEELITGDIAGLAANGMRYSLLTDPHGGIRDDLMVARRGSDLFLVVNAAFKASDLAHIRAHLEPEVAVEYLEGQALLALQGPEAVGVLDQVLAGVADLTFMTSGLFRYEGADLLVSRSGYTGEDGFEISVPEGGAESFARRLLESESVQPIGLGARNTLRLEAGLCLSGQDITELTSPIEAALAWTVNKRRRAEANFPGAQIILQQLAQGVRRKRVGLILEGRVPAREHAKITDRSGVEIGEVTSGSFSPTLGQPIAMGYVDVNHTAPGTDLDIVVRGRAYGARVVTMPFVKHRYVRS